ncbi:MAG: SH3 domain-containing protein [Planctomycetota bacterium]|nr:SH3 domain-containing protein [Planctomycetota bacterium]
MSRRLPSASVKRLRPGLLWLLLLPVLFGAAPRAEAALTQPQREAILAEAQELYDRGVALRGSDPEAAREVFRDAAARFRQLIDDGVRNGHLHYNLGNAYLQAGEIGRAILEYRRAERYTPGEARLAHNLEYARSLRRDRIAPSGERALARALLAWHLGTSIGSRFAVFAAAYLVFWLVSLAHLFRPAATWRWAAGLAAVLWLACGISVLVDVTWDGSTRQGVVLVDEVIVRKGNGEGFEPQFEQPLHQGVEFEVLDRRGDWFQIELRDGKTGWIRADQAGLVNEVSRSATVQRQPRHARCDDTMPRSRVISSKA